MQHRMRAHMHHTSNKQTPTKYRARTLAQPQVQDLAQAEQNASVPTGAQRSPSDGIHKHSKKGESMDAGHNAHGKTMDDGGEDDPEAGKKKDSEKQMLEEAKMLPPVSFGRIWQTQRPEWGIFIYGSLCAMAGGAVQPIFAVIYSGIISALFLPNDDMMRQAAKEYLGWFFLLGVSQHPASTQPLCSLYDCGKAPVCWQQTYSIVCKHIQFVHKRACLHGFAC
jgi:hypothetical protein